MLADILIGVSIFISESPKTSIAIALACAGAYYLAIYPFFISPLRSIPGPYLFRISKFRALNGQRTNRWINTVYDLHKKYGNVVVISPEEVSVNGDFKYVQDIYVRNFPKSKFYENFRNHGFRDNIFASLENDRHLKYKKILMPLYQKSTLYSTSNSTRSMLREKVSQLVDQVYISSVTGEKPDYINAKSEHNEFGKGHLLKDDGAWLDTSSKTNLGIDVYSLFASLAMDVVSAFELGTENGTDLLLHPEDRHIIVSHRLQAGMGFWTTLMPRWWDWAATKEILEASATVESWQMELYANAEKAETKRSDDDEKYTNLCSLATLKKNGFFGKDAYSFLSDNIFAGHETTAIQLAYLTYELSRPSNAHIQARLVKELKDTFGEKSGDSYDIIDDLETVESLKFLDAIFQENSRIHTSIPGSEPRVTSKAYPVVDEKKGTSLVIPEGTVISCQPYAVHRQESVFPNPNCFIPERWLQFEQESDFDYKQRMIAQQKYMMPFGKGIRMCLGMNLAVIEMKLAIANLYYNFHSEISPDWCTITPANGSKVGDKDTAANPIEVGGWKAGANATDEEKMCMVDSYTTRPLNDEVWLRWFKN
ncbi:hypothetical protein CLIB1423_20S02124 [[Candida] railenensis]|uniref:Cytochrome P450 n=1 Tax=[Candida] railenensis TaxID=45579 RepID=A0A9P0QUT9_9ASCO|nr:hypothetical protein CLIB1423_20S02124 [[Candida] railenensis]